MKALVAAPRRAAIGLWRAVVPQRVRAELYVRRTERKVMGLLSHGFGLHRSLLENACIDSDGRALPWYTYPAIEYLDQLDLSDARVFEFGCGNSTMFWAERAASVISVEHDKIWAERMTQKTNGAQVTVRLQPDAAAYVKAIEDGGPFDVIVVDGIERLASAKAALPHRKRGGFFVLDNSDGYPNVAQCLRETGDLLQIDFNGFGPHNTVPWRTSIFLDRDFAWPRRAGGRRLFTGAY